MFKGFFKLIFTSPLFLGVIQTLLGKLTGAGVTSGADLTPTVLAQHGGEVADALPDRTFGGWFKTLLTSPLFLDLIRRLLDQVGSAPAGAAMAPAALATHVGSAVDSMPN